VKDRPNAQFAEERKDGGQLKMAVMSSQEVIKKGEEIVVSYGKSFWKSREIT
jgi:SET domain-containing protein